MPFNPLPPKPALTSTSILGSLLTLASLALTFAASNGVIDGGLAELIERAFGPLGELVGIGLAIAGRFNPNIRPVTLTGR